MCFEAWIFEVSSSYKSSVYSDKFSIEECSIVSEIEGCRILSGRCKK